MSKTKKVLEKIIFTIILAILMVPTGSVAGNTQRVLDMSNKTSHTFESNGGDINNVIFQYGNLYCIEHAKGLARPRMEYKKIKTITFDGTALEGIQDPTEIDRQFANGLGYILYKGAKRITTGKTYANDPYQLALWIYLAYYDPSSFFGSCLTRCPIFYEDTKGTMIPKGYTTTKNVLLDEPYYFWLDNEEDHVLWSSNMVSLEVGNYTFRRRNK